MNITTQANGDAWLLVLSGSWESSDGEALKKTLDSLPCEPTPLRIDLGGLDSLPIPALQILWAYIRYARGFRRPVEVFLGPQMSEIAAVLGLFSGGWEAYFHAR